MTAAPKWSADDQPLAESSAWRRCWTLLTNSWWRSAHIATGAAELTNSLAGSVSRYVAEPVNAIKAGSSVYCCAGIV
jgi:hypothetical protein